MQSQGSVAIAMLEEASGAVSVEEFQRAGVARTTVQRLVDGKMAVRVAVGHFALPGKIDIMDEDWVAFALQVPRGVLGLLTAAVHHEMTQEHAVALQAFVPRDRGTRVKLPGNTLLTLITSRNPDFLEAGVETLRRSGTDIRVTSKERTLLDMFLFSPFNSATTKLTVKIPEESFLDSLNRCVVDPEFSFDELHELAETFGCASKIAPFTKTLRFGASQANIY